MKRLGLGEYAAIAEVIATIGVIISLVLVAHSMESNTTQVQASQINSIYEQARAIELAVASDPEWVNIILKGHDPSEDLTAVELYRYDTYIVSMLDLWDQLLSRNSEGLVPDHEISGWDGFFEAWVRRNLSQSDWQRLRWNYAGDIIPRMESIFAGEEAK